MFQFSLWLLVKLRKRINLVDVCQNISYSLTPWNLLLGLLSSLTISQHRINVCICTSVFYSACVVYHMCSTVYLAHMGPTIQAAGILPHHLFHSISLLSTLKPKYLFYFTFLFLNISTLALTFFLSFLPCTFSFFNLLCSISSALCTVCMPSLIPQHFSH